MTGGGDEVEHGVNTVVAEARVTLDPRLLGENVIILPLKVTNDLREAADKGQLAAAREGSLRRESAYLASLSMLSPNPGVSTMVREMRVPSSSSSSSRHVLEMW